MPGGQSEGAPAELGWKGELGMSLSDRATRRARASGPGGRGDRSQEAGLCLLKEGGGESGGQRRGAGRATG